MKLKERNFEILNSYEPLPVNKELHIGELVRDTDGEEYFVMNSSFDVVLTDTGGYMNILYKLVALNNPADIITTDVYAWNNYFQRLV